MSHFMEKSKSTPKVLGQLLIHGQSRGKAFRGSKLTKLPQSPNSNLNSAQSMSRQQSSPWKNKSSEKSKNFTKFGEMV